MIMQCPQCNKMLEDQAAFCGNCGAQIRPLHSGGNATVVSDATQQAKAPGNQAFSNRAAPRTALDESFVQIPAHTPQTPPPYRPAAPKPRRGNVWRVALIALIVLVLAAGGTIGAVFALNRHTTGNSNPPTARNTVPVSVPGASGQVAFFDNASGTPGYTDALKIILENLKAPPSGSQYDAWLIDDVSEQVTPLGTLTQSGNSFTLNFTSGTNGTQPHLNLIGAGNRLEVTLEQGAVSAPSGKVVLSGIFPPKAFVHIRHLLFRFPTTPKNIGLLVGLLQQTQALNAQALLLQSLSGSGNTRGIQCVTQSIIDISEGAHGAHYQALTPWCIAHYTAQQGDGFGILNQGYAATASAHAALAAIQTDATDNIRLHAHHVEIATANIKGWVTTVDQDAVKLLATPTDTSVVPEIVALSDHAYHGVAGPDGQVDPVPGEAGAITAYIHGQFMAALPLVSG
jgi:hypothetical protein